MKPSQSRPRLNALPSYSNTKNGELQRRRHSYHLNAMQQDASSHTESRTPRSSMSSARFRSYTQQNQRQRSSATMTQHYPPLTRDRLEKKNKLDLLLSGRPTAGIRRLAHRRSISNGYIFRHIYNEDGKPMKWLDQIEDEQQKRRVGSTEASQNSPSTSKVPSGYDHLSQSVSTRKAQGQRSPAHSALSDSNIQPTLSVHPKSHASTIQPAGATDRSASTHFSFWDREQIPPPPRRLSKLLAMAATQREQQQQQDQQQQVPSLAAAARKPSSTTPPSESSWWYRALCAVCIAAGRVVDARSCETTSTYMDAEDVTSLARYIYALESRKSNIGKRDIPTSETARDKKPSYARSHLSDRQGSSQQQQQQHPFTIPDEFDLLPREEEGRMDERSSPPWNAVRSRRRTMTTRGIFIRRPPSAPASEDKEADMTRTNAATKVSSSFPDSQLYASSSPPPPPSPPGQESNYEATGRTRRRLKRFSSAMEILRKASIQKLLHPRREETTPVTTGEEEEKHPIFASIDEGPGVPISFEGWSLGYFGPTSELRFKLWKYIASK